VVDRQPARLRLRRSHRRHSHRRHPTGRQRIYKSVDLDDPSTVRDALAAWIKDDLAL